MSKTYSQEELDKIVKGLKDNRDNLLTEVTEIKKKFKAFDGEDIESLRKSAEELNKLKTQQAEKEGKYKDLYNTTVKTIDDMTIKHKAEMSELTGKLDKSTVKFQAMDELRKANVIPELIDAALTITVGDAQLVDGKVMVNNKPLNDFVSEWSATTIGKHFINSGNSGGGAGGGSGDGEPPEAKFFKKGTQDYNLTAQSKLANTNPELHSKLATKYANYKPADK